MSLRKSFSSTVGQKFIMALSGMALVLYAIVHLLGNLTLYLPSGNAFNTYAFKLHEMETLILVAEVGLLAVIVVHVIVGIRVSIRNRSARPVKYEGLRTKGGPSYSNLSSRNMMIAGAVLLGFLIMHVGQFRFGPGVTQG